MSLPLLKTIDGVEKYDCDTVFVIRRPVEYGNVEEFKLLDNVFDLYKEKGYLFFADRENAQKYLDGLKKISMIHEFNNPIPVIVEGDKDEYAIYVRDGSTWENDIFTVVHCDGGIVRHYRSDQIRVHQNFTFDIKKKNE